MSGHFAPAPTSAPRGAYDQRPDGFTAPDGHTSGRERSERPNGQTSDGNTSHGSHAHGVPPKADAQVKREAASEGDAGSTKTRSALNDVHNSAVHNVNGATHKSGKGPDQPWGGYLPGKVRKVITEAYKRVKDLDGHFLAWRDEVPTIRAGIAELQKRDLELPKEFASEQWAELQAEYDQAKATMPEGWKPPKRQAKSTSRPQTFREIDEARDRARSRRRWD
jgi:hypothetical protein